MTSLDDLHEIARAFGGIPVLSCTQGSPAERAGIRHGDVLVQMNGKPTPTLEAYVEAQGSGQMQVPVTVIRDGVALELVLVHVSPRSSDVAKNELHGDATTSLDEAESSDRDALRLIAERLVAQQARASIERAGLRSSRPRRLA